MPAQCQRRPYRSPRHVGTTSAVKQRLVAGVQPEQGTAIVGVDDGWSRKSRRPDRAIRKPWRPISVKKHLHQQVLSSVETDLRRRGGARTEIARIGGAARPAQRAECTLRSGRALAMGVGIEMLQNGLRSFPGLAHRMNRSARAATCCSSTTAKAPIRRRGARAVVVLRSFPDRRRQTKTRRQHRSNRIFPATSAKPT